MNKSDYLVLHETFTGLTGYPKSWGGFTHALHGLCDTRLMGIAFARIVGFCCAIGDPSFEVVSLCFPTGSEGKLLKWLQEHIEKLIDVEQRKNMVRLITRETPYGSACQRVGCWCATHSIWILGIQADSVERPMKRRFCSFCDTDGLHSCTSAFDNHQDDKWSLSSKIYNWDSHLRRMWCSSGYKIASKISVIGINLSISTMLSRCFPHVFIVDEWSPVPHKSPWASLSLVLQCRLLNVTLQLPLIPKIESR